jgi:hypothetical protein
MRLYLDVSCLNRPFDDQLQERIRLESEAALLIIDRIDRGDCEQIVSDIIRIEIAATRDSVRRSRVTELLPEHAVLIGITAQTATRARALVGLGLQNADALHVASAEAANADVLLTCDDRLVRWGRRHVNAIHVAIANPVEWIGALPDGNDP